MAVRVRKLGSDIAETFWLVPALIVAALVGPALGLVEPDRTDLVPRWPIDGPFEGKPA